MFRFTHAEDILRTTLSMVTDMAKRNNESISDRWEPLLNNLGHCCRKNKKYEEALKFHQQVLFFFFDVFGRHNDIYKTLYFRKALILKPMTAATYTAIGFVQALMGNLELAAESLHRSLALKRDDIVTSALLNFCIEDLVDESAVSDNVLDAQMKSLLMQPAATGSDDPKSILNRMKMQLTYDDSVNSGGGGEDIIDNSDMSVEY